MNTPAISDGISALLIGQPNDVLGLSDDVRDRMIVFINHANGHPEIESLYGDAVWWPVGAGTNVSRSRVKLDFNSIPAAFREISKAIVYRYIRRGHEERGRPKAYTIATFFSCVLGFLRYVNDHGIICLNKVTPFVCSSFLQHEKEKSKHNTQVITGAHGCAAAPKKKSLYKKIRAVEMIYALSQYTDTPMHDHPWPTQSAHRISGLSREIDKTPLMPNDVFEGLFQAAWQVVQRADELLDLRDAMTAFEQANSHFVEEYVTMLKNEELSRRGYDGTMGTLKPSLTEIRTACYIVVASLSGCRNHELANLRVGSVHSTRDIEGNLYWWMRSVSTKTGEGASEWMIPEAAVKAIHVLERWALPLQKAIRAEIAELTGTSPQDKRISHPAAHVDAIFLGVDKKANNRVRTITLQSLNSALKAFAAKAGLDWKPASHQFRRKFANYAARSQFGDLRYLKEHFKHWSMDMTLGYALNESQEMALYLEIQDELDGIKQEIVERWVDSTEPLAGGYGRGLIEWRSRSDNIVMFKSRTAMIKAIAQSTPIRSNGHAWCTAQDNLCVGNDLERTRCGNNCENAVIGSEHKRLYEGLHSQLLELEKLDDIGESGKLRVRQDLERCRKILDFLNPGPAEGA